MRARPYRYLKAYVYNIFLNRRCWNISRRYGLSQSPECNHFNAWTNCDVCVRTRRVLSHSSSWHIDISKPSRLDLKFLRSHPIIIYRLTKNVCGDYARLVHDRNPEAGTFQFGVPQNIFNTLCIHACGFRSGVARMSKTILMRRAWS